MDLNKIQGHAGIPARGLPKELPSELTSTMLKTALVAVNEEIEHFKARKHEYSAKTLPNSAKTNDLVLKRLSA